MTRETLIAALAARDPLAAVRTLGVTPSATVTVVHAPPDEASDQDEEGDITQHRAAHQDGIRTQAVVRYGAGIDDAHIADRLLALAGLARETGMLDAVTPIPSAGSSARPGSWGVEDLVVIAAVRATLPDSVAVRPSWEKLGAPAAQVALAFGATQWWVPSDDDTDLDRLARSAGVTLERT